MKDPISIEVDVNNCKVKVPNDLMALQDVYLKNYNGLDEYAIVTCLAGGELFLRDEWSKIKKVFIRYIPFDMERINKAIHYLKLRHPGLQIEHYWRSVMIGNVDYFESFEYNLFGIGTRHDSFVEKSIKYLTKITNLTAKDCM